MKKKTHSPIATAGSEESWKIPIEIIGSRVNSEIGLYFHVPFCTKKCPYCHFYVVPNRRDLQGAFMEGLRLEWQSLSEKLLNKKVVSVYFGGGTPALLDTPYLAEILSWIPLRTQDTEITIEANPEKLDYALSKEFKKLGINRLSLGVQSLDDSSLQEIGRMHSAIQAKQAILDAKRAGFDNISIDLMFELPGQTTASWKRTLDSLSTLPIDHLSLYNLTIEPHTSFYKKKEALIQKIPNSEESFHHLQMGLECFEKLGLYRYEISAFAKDSKESRHNSGYWKARPFLGLGPSAFSYWEGKRTRNIAHLQRYRRALLEKKSPIDFEEKLLFPESLHELLAVRLRMLDGAPDSPLFPAETRSKLENLKKMGLLQLQDERWKLTERGLLFYDTVGIELT